MRADSPANRRRPGASAGRLSRAQPPSGQPPAGYGQHPNPPPPQLQRRPPPIDAKLVRPSLHWLWLAPLPVLLGVGLAALIAVHVFHTFDHLDLHHLRPPQTIVLDLGEGDARGIYAQTSGVVGAGPDVAATGLSCAVAEVASARAVAPRPSTSVTTLTINQDSYVERLHFSVPRSGRYSVRCDRPRGAPLATARDVSVGTTLLEIGGVVACIVVGVLATGAIAGVTLLRRWRHRKRLHYQAWTASGLGPPPSGPQIGSNP